MTQLDLSFIIQSKSYAGTSPIYSDSRDLSGESHSLFLHSMTRFEDKLEVIEVLYEQKGGNLHLWLVTYSHKTLESRIQDFKREDSSAMSDLIWDKGCSNRLEALLDLPNISTNSEFLLNHPNSPISD